MARPLTVSPTGPGLAEVIDLEADPGARLSGWSYRTVSDILTEAAGSPGELVDDGTGRLWHDTPGGWRPVEPFDDDRARDARLEHGGIGDGTSHPLSERFATLVEAQAVYPHAQALTDEIDWCALQAVIDEVTGAATPVSNTRVAARRVRFPAGTWMLNRPLQVTSVLGVICDFGGGEIRGTAAGMESVVDLNGVAFSTFENLTITTGTGADCTRALWVRWDNTLAARSTTSVTFTNVAVRNCHYTRAGIEIGQTGTGVQVDNTRWLGCSVDGDPAWHDAGDSDATAVCWWVGDSLSANNLLHTFLGCSANRGAHGVKVDSTSVNWVGGSVQQNHVSDFWQGGVGPLRVEGIRSEGSAALLTQAGANSADVAVELLDVLFQTVSANLAANDRVITWNTGGRLIIDGLRVTNGAGDPIVIYISTPTPAQVFGRGVSVHGRTWDQAFQVFGPAEVHVEYVEVSTGGVVSGIRRARIEGSNRRFLLDHVHADETTVAPATPGAATLAEIQTYATSVGAVGCEIVYTATDVQTDDPLATYWADGSGTVTLLAEAGATADQTAADVPFTPTANLTATDVQAALAEATDSPSVTLTGANGVDLLGPVTQIPQTDFTAEWTFLIDDVTPATPGGLGGLYLTSGATRGWAVSVHTDGTVRVYGSADGSAAETQSTDLPIAAAGIEPGKLARLRVDFEFRATIVATVSAGPVDGQPTVLGRMPFAIAGLVNTTTRAHLGSRFRTGAGNADGREGLDGAIQTFALTVAGAEVLTYPAAGWTHTGTDNTVPLAADRQWGPLPVSDTRTEVRVDRYAPGDGRDHTDLLDEIAAHCHTQGVPMIFGPGQWLYSGAGWNYDRYRIRGASASATEIVLDTGVVLCNPSAALQAVDIADLEVSGGTGFFHHTSTGVASGIEGFDFRRLILSGYTGAAIATESADSAYWRVKHCQFTAANDTTSFGVVLGGDQLAGSVIEDCAFRANACHIKIDNGGADVAIIRARMFRKAPDGSNPRPDLWVIPDDDGTGFRLYVAGGSWSNENLQPYDYRIVYADPAPGARRVALPDYSTVSTGEIRSHMFHDVEISGGAGNTNPFVYSTTPNVSGCSFAPLVSGTVPTSFLGYAAGAAPTGLGDLIVGPNHIAPRAAVVAWLDYTASSGPDDTYIDGMTSRRVGATADRPTAPAVGQEFWDTDLDASVRWTGAAWVVQSSGSGGDIARTYDHIYSAPSGTQNPALAADVTAGDLAVGDVIRTAAYYQGGDRGGAIYRVVAAATGTEDFGEYHDIGTLQLELVAGDEVDAHTFGVDPAHTDNTAGLIAAIKHANGRWTTLGPGTYTCLTSVAVSDGTEVRLRGAGQEATILSLDDVATDRVVFSNTDWAEVRDLQVTKGYGGESQTFAYFGEGLKFINVDTVRWSRVTISGVSGMGIVAQNCGDIQGVDSRLWGIGRDGIHVNTLDGATRRTRRVVIDRAQLEKIGDDAVVVHSMQSAGTAIKTDTTATVTAGQTTAPGGALPGEWVWIEDAGAGGVCPHVSKVAPDGTLERPVLTAATSARVVVNNLTAENILIRAVRVDHKPVGSAAGEERGAGISTTGCMRVQVVDCQTDNVPGQGIEAVGSEHDPLLWAQEIRVRNCSVSNIARHAGATPASAVYPGLHFTHVDDLVVTRDCIVSNGVHSGLYARSISNAILDPTVINCGSGSSTTQGGIVVRPANGYFTGSTHGSADITVGGEGHSCEPAGVNLETIHGDVTVRDSSWRNCGNNSSVSNQFWAGIVGNDFPGTLTIRQSRAKGCPYGLILRPGTTTIPELTELDNDFRGNTTGERWTLAPITTYRGGPVWSYDATDATYTPNDARIFIQKSGDPAPTGLAADDAVLAES